MDEYRMKLCKTSIGIDELLAGLQDADEVAILLTTSLLQWCPKTKEGRLNALGIAILMARLLKERCEEDE